MGRLWRCAANAADQMPNANLPTDSPCMPHPAAAQGPHLVVVPLSVLPSWLSEFQRWSPQVTGLWGAAGGPRWFPLMACRLSTRAAARLRSCTSAYLVPQAQSAAATTDLQQLTLRRSVPVPSNLRAACLSSCRCGWCACTAATTRSGSA